MEKNLRNKIYRVALESMKSDLEYPGIWCGLCTNLQFGIDKYGLDNKYDAYFELKKGKNEENAFPEIIKHKPDKNAIIGHWFKKDEEGMQKRISILEQAIKETE